jgi:uncharacterized protein with GYD domain
MDVKGDTFRSKGSRLMPTYILLITYTQKGIENIKGSPSRLDAARQAARHMGGDIKASYLTMGRFDEVLIAEAPNDEVAATLLLATGASGNVRTETLKAFNEDEARKIIAGLP